MANTKISWCDKVWNPVTGCTKVSEGCRNCYAEVMAKRLRAMGQPHYANGFKVTCHEDALDMPLHWRKPARIFVNSMSDLFHKDVPLKFIVEVFDTIAHCPQHTFMILTKRPERAREFWTWLGKIPYKNVWLGVSVENQRAADERIPLLIRTPAAVRFLSCEPLLEGIILQGNGEYDDKSVMVNRQYLHGTTGDERINWVIVGGESGPHCRPMNPDWARILRDQCKAADVPFFFKQTGGLHHGSDLLDGMEYKDFPV